MQKIKNLQK